MKKYVFILMAIMLLAVAPAVYSADFENSTIPGLNMTTDIDLAMNAAQSENKSVAIFFDQASCAYCDMLKNNVLSNSDVQKQLNENYVMSYFSLTSMKILNSPISTGFTELLSSSSSSLAVRLLMKSRDMSRLMNF